MAKCVEEKEASPELHLPDSTFRRFCVQLRLGSRGKHVTPRSRSETSGRVYRLVS